MQTLIKPGMRCYVNKTWKAWSSNTMVRVVELVTNEHAYVIHEATNTAFHVPLSYLTIPRRYR